MLLSCYSEATTLICPHSTCFMFYFFGHFLLLFCECLKIELFFSFKVASVFPLFCAIVCLRCLFDCLQISSDRNDCSGEKKFWVIFSVWQMLHCWRMVFVSLIVCVSRFHVLFFSPLIQSKRLLLFEVPILHVHSWKWIWCLYFPITLQ